MLLLMLSFACDLAPKTCNLMYAPDIVSITLEGASPAPDVDTVYAFEGDGETIRCTLAAGEEYAVCDDNSGSGFEVSGDSLTGSLWEFTPEVLSVTVTEDGAELGSWSAEPRWQRCAKPGDGTSAGGSSRSRSIARPLSWAPRELSRSSA